MDETSNLSLPFIQPAQALKHITHNEALLRLDGLVQLAVLDRHLSAPPVSPVEGDRYIVAAGATGAWSGWEGDVALFASGGWLRLSPAPGWQAFVGDESLIVYWDGTGWQRLGATISAADVAVAPGGAVAASHVQGALANLSAAIANDAGFAASMASALAGRAAASAGSWTPAVSFGGVSTGITYGARSGFWRRFEDVVLAFGTFTLSSRGSASGTARVTGLPASAGANFLGTGKVNFYADFAALGGTPMIEVNSGTTTATFYNPGATSSAAMTEANFTNSSRIFFLIVYQAV